MQKLLIESAIFFFWTNQNEISYIPRWFNLHKVC